MENILIVQKFSWHIEDLICANKLGFGLKKQKRTLIQNRLSDLYIKTKYFFLKISLSLFNTLMSRSKQSKSVRINTSLRKKDLLYTTLILFLQSHFSNVFIKHH